MELRITIPPAFSAPSELKLTLVDVVDKGVWFLYHYIDQNGLSHIKTVKK